MSLARQHHKIEPFIGFHKSIDNPQRIPGMYIVINVTMDKQQMSLEIFRQILVLFYPSLKGFSQSFFLVPFS